MEQLLSQPNRTEVLLSKIFFEKFYLNMNFTNFTCASDILTLLNVYVLMISPFIKTSEKNTTEQLKVYVYIISEAF